MNLGKNFSRRSSLQSLVPVFLVMGLGWHLWPESASAQKNVVNESDGKAVVGAKAVVGGAIIRGMVYEDRDQDAVKDHIDPFKQGVVVDLLYDFDANPGAEVGVSGRPGERGFLGRRVPVSDPGAGPGSDREVTAIRPRSRDSGFKIVATTSTNEDGAYRFAQLMPGDYKLRFEFSPEVMVRSKRITISTGSEEIFSPLPVIEDPSQAVYRELDLELVSFPPPLPVVVVPPRRKTTVKLPPNLKRPPNPPNITEPPDPVPPPITEPPTVTTVSAFMP